MNLTQLEIEALEELVWGTLDSLATDGEDDPKTATYEFWEALYAKIHNAPNL